MMLSEAIAQKLDRVRDPKWVSKNAYLRIPWCDAERTHHGVVFKVFDREYQELLKFPTPQEVVILSASNERSEVEPYSGPIDPADLDVQKPEGG